MTTPFRSLILTKMPKPLRKILVKKSSLQTKDNSVKALQTTDTPSSRKLHSVYDIKTNQMIHYDEQTGERVSQEVLKGKSFEPFNEPKFNAICELISRGMILKNALKHTGVSSSSFLMWQKSRPELKHLLIETKRQRNQAIQEQVYEKDVQPINRLNIMEMDNVEVAEIDKKLRAVAKKQSIINNFTQNQVPEEAHNDRISIGQLQLTKIEIPQDLVQKLDQKFRPTDKGDGVYSLPEPTEQEKEVEALLAKMSS